MKINSLQILSFALAISVCLVSCGTAPVTSSKKPSKKQDKNNSIVEMSVVNDISFSSLPLGSIQAESWLENQLRLQANVLYDYEEIVPTLKTVGEDRSGWLGGTGAFWEEAPYYIRGLVATAYTLKDEKLIKQSQKWIDWILQSQTESGCFGPLADVGMDAGAIAHNSKNFDWWPLMPVLITLIDYYEATQDDRVIPFLEKYFAYQHKAIAGQIPGMKGLSGWSAQRAGDNIYAALWLYRQNGDKQLLDLCERLYLQADQYNRHYKSFSDSLHIVNVQQSFKLFPLMYSASDKEKSKQTYKQLYQSGIDNLYMASGRQDGLSNGDEVTNAGISAVRGTETCAVVERIFCDKIALNELRDATIADHIENVAYNALPQQYLPDNRGYAYFTMQNQIEATLGSKHFSTGYSSASCYGFDSGFFCCGYNRFIGWPQFVSSMWMCTSDGGLAVGAYGPNSVTTNIGDAKNFSIEQETNYPYEDTIKLTVSTDKTIKMPLYLRIPEWCNKASLKVNGKTEKFTAAAGEYFKLERAFKNGDVIELAFPMEFRTTITENNSVSIKYGAVLFALKIEESWSTTNFTTKPDWNAIKRNYANYEIHPASDWNYALKDFNFKDVASNFKINKTKIKDDMQFKQSDIPITLTATGIKVNSWIADEQKTAGETPISPVSNGLGDTKSVTLVPYAFSRLRIALLPWTGNSEVLTFKKDKIQESDDRVVISNVILPHTETEKEQTTSNGELIINYSSEKIWEAQIFVNRKFHSAVIFEEGDSSITLNNLLKAYEKYHNIIEIKTKDGSKIPKNFTCEVFAG